MPPYIFIMCANVLSRLIAKESQKINIHGIKVDRQAPHISHNFFAYDSLLFARATQHEEDCILGVLDA